MQAHLDCRQHKRNTENTALFELDLAHNLGKLYDELIAGTWYPGASIRFVITHPKCRDVWAAQYATRVVHHLFYRRVAPLFLNRFTADSCACIPGRGTLYGAERLEGHIRSITQNWSKPAWYLKIDLANFFMEIDKRLVYQELARYITDPWWLDLGARILFHDPRQDYEYRGDLALLERVPFHKRLTSQDEHHGLPIGNLSSQFFANVLLNRLDQHIKHHLWVRYCVRYVDDTVILGHSPQWLEAVHHAITLFLPEIGLRLNESKTVLQPVNRGVDFVGQVIKPWRRRIRRRTFRHALQQLRTVSAADLMTTANSYFGLCRQATKSFSDRIRLGRTVLRRGRTVNGALTQTYRSKAS